jgi:hypothetical protein
MPHIRRLLSVALATSLVLIGCHRPDSADPAIHRWDGLVSDLRVQWDAEPGIDLLEGLAVPVRAYLESRLLAQYTGQLNQTYPGFTRAVPSNEPGESPNISARDRRPSLENPLTSPVVGNSRFHIQRVESSGHDIAVDVCNYVYGMAEKQTNGKYLPFVDFGPVETRGIITMRILLSAPPNDSATALAPQTGPASAPTNDVFGDWQIVGFLVATGSQGATGQWPRADADRAACINNAPDPLQRRTFLVTGEHPRSDFPTSPPSPGWPAS